MNKPGLITRRKFLQNTTLFTAGGLYFKGQDIFSMSQTDKSRVVLVRDEGVLDHLNKPKKEVLAEMVNKAVCILFEAATPAEAWKKIISPHDIVGIKSNFWNYLPTPPVLDQIIKEGVISAGVKEETISVRDNGLLDDPVFLNSTALINVRPMRTHHWSGVGSLLKNYLMFVEKPWEYHGDSCADLGTLWKLPLIAGKTRLNILVMLTPLFHGIGPHHFNPEFTWRYNGIIAGTDPVAIDATGVRILQEKRKQFFKQEMPLNPPAKHIFLADTRHGIGTADPGKIELIRTGWEEDILI